MTAACWDWSLDMADVTIELYCDKQHGGYAITQTVGKKTVLRAVFVGGQIGERNSPLPDVMRLFTDIARSLADHTFKPVRGLCSTGGGPLELPGDYKRVGVLTRTDGAVHMDIDKFF